MGVRDKKVQKPTYKIQVINETKYKMPFFLQHPFLVGVKKVLRQYIKEPFQIRHSVEQIHILDFFLDIAPKYVARRVA